MKKFWITFHAKRLTRLKLKFITWFSAKRPGKYCWADCVAWAYSPHRFNPFKVENARGCKVESLIHFWETCYCGKWANGECYDLMSDFDKAKVREKRDLELPENIPF